MFVEWCVLISVQVSREERTFRVNMFVEWCVLIRFESLERAYFSSEHVCGLVCTN